MTPQRYRLQARARIRAAILLAGAILTAAGASLAYTAGTHALIFPAVAGAIALAALSIPNLITSSSKP